MKDKFKVSADGEVIAVHNVVDGKAVGGDCLFEKQEAIDICDRCEKLGFDMEIINA